MRLVTLALGAAGLAAAQTTISAASASSTGSASGCVAQVDLIVQSCLGMEMAQVNACTPNDWDCLCTQWKNVMTCYANCPSDPDAFGASQSQTQYCAAAAAYGSAASSSKTATATSAVGSESTAAVAVATVVSASASSTSPTDMASASPISTAFSSPGAIAKVPMSLFAIFGMIALW